MVKPSGLGNSRLLADRLGGGGELREVTVGLAGRVASATQVTLIARLGGRSAANGVITKDSYTYSIKILRQEKSLRDHGRATVGERIGVHRGEEGTRPFGRLSRNAVASVESASPTGFWWIAAGFPRRSTSERHRSGLTGDTAGPTTCRCNAAAPLTPSP